jgi:hypothetical protein
VRSRLRAELEDEAKAAALAAKVVATTPATEAVAQPADEAPKPAIVAVSAFGGSRFDRFGSGGGRQMNMYG